MEWSGAHSLYWRSLTAGAATWSSLYCLYKGCVHQNDQIPKRPRALCPKGLYSWWHFASPANGSGSCDCAPVMWAYGAPCPAMVPPNVGLRKEGKLLYLDHHLIWCTKSGFRPAHFPPLLSWSPTIVGGLQIILQSFFGLNPKLIRLNTI